METRHPATKVDALPAQTLVERFAHAVGILYLGDFLTDGERRKVHERMMKWRAATAHLPPPADPPKKKLKKKPVTKKARA